MYCSLIALQGRLRIFVLVEVILKAFFFLSVCASPTFQVLSRRAALYNGLKKALYRIKHEHLDEGIVTDELKQISTLTAEPWTREALPYLADAIDLLIQCQVCIYQRKSCFYVFYFKHCVQCFVGFLVVSVTCEAFRLSFFYDHGR